MANRKHLNILKEGVEVWNKWREENPDIRPDLSGAKLTRADLIGANLRKADLIEANLRSAVFWNADLHGTMLIGTNFTLGDFLDADLRGANFYGANFNGANLENTKVSESTAGMTLFGDVDLSKVLGLETIVHQRPSTIGLDTLYKSKGNIPEVFLRGCGVPDQMIEYAKSLTANLIEYYSCFISYSSKDEEFAKRLWEGLQAKNVRCWYAPHDLKIGDKIRLTIDDSIRIHDKLLLILSEHSVQSDWVEHEVEHALDLEKEREKGVLFPVRVDEAVMESKTGWAGNVRRQRHIGDFTRWKDHDAYSEAFERLLRDLKAG